MLKPAHLFNVTYRQDGHTRCTQVIAGCVREAKRLVKLACVGALVTNVEKI